MNTMLALLYKWYQKLTQPKRDIQYPNTQTNNDFEVVNMNDIEMTLNDYVQVGLYKGLYYITYVKVYIACLDEGSDRIDL